MCFFCRLLPALRCLLFWPGLALSTWPARPPPPPAGQAPGEEGRACRPPLTGQDTVQGERGCGQGEGKPLRGALLGTGQERGTKQSDDTWHHVAQPPLAPDPVPYQPGHPWGGQGIHLQRASCVLSEEAEHCCSRCKDEQTKAERSQQEGVTQIRGFQSNF